MIERDYKINKTKLILLLICGNATFFILSVRNFPHILPFDLISSAMCSIVFTSYAYLSFNFSKIEIIQIFIYGIISGFIIPLIIPIIIFSFFYH